MKNRVINSILVSQRVRLIEVARSAIAACDGRALVRPALADARVTNVWAIGKAARAMALGVADALGLPAELVIGKEDAGHPIPDERSVRACEEVLRAAAATDESSRVLLLLSGGASSLVGAPIDGVSLDELREATRALTRSGAPIGEINAVRRRLSRLGGGKLARATRGTIEVLALSDVIGNDPAAIGSGPASPDPTTLDDALAIARARGLGAGVIEQLERAPATLRPGDPAFERVRYRVLADPLALLDAGVRAATDAGLRARPRQRLVTEDHELLLVELVAAADSLLPGEALIAAGEPTVRVTGDGLGGRAQQLALRMARLIAGRDLAFVACGSDGTDGPTDAAGAAVDGDTWQAALDRGLDPAKALARFDAHPLLDALGATLVTGATGTNLTDLLLLARGA
jgi:glycerate-2-kinase